MFKNFILIFITVLISSCYNYDGPTRPKETSSYGINDNNTSNGNYNKSTNDNTKGGSNNNNGNNDLNVRPNISSKEYLDDIVRDIKRTLPSAQVSVIEDSIKVLFPDNILYSNSSVMPKEDIYIEMSKLAKLLIKYDKTNVLVTGHTDNLGKSSENKRLSSIRASYISDLLISYQLPQNRVNSWGLGSVSPISSNSTEAGRQRNRRVEFIILSTIQDEEEL